MGTVHQFPSQRKQDRHEPVDHLARALRVAVDNKVGADASFERREGAALELTNEATRLFLQDELEVIGARFGVRVEVDGVVYKQHEPGVVRYYTLCGSADIERWTYREVGVQNGPTIVPLELAAGLVERTTPALGSRIALGYAKGHMRSCEEDMKSDHRCPPSRSTLERTAKAIGDEASKAARRIESRIRNAEALPEGTVAVSIGLDRTSVPMEETVSPGEKPAGRRKERVKPYERTKPERIDVNYRMAYVGTIAFHDSDGEVLATRRYAAAADESPTERLVEPLMGDLRNALRRAPQLAVGVVQDGAPELWNLMSPALAAEPLVTHWYEAIDRYHLNERLAKALRLVEPNAGAREAKSSQWNDSLDEYDDAIDSIGMWLAERYIEAVNRNDDEVAKELNDHLTYLDNNCNRMAYAHLYELGLPVGSGVTEGACKSVVQMRTNSCGQRWRPEGLSAVLTLRAVYLSERLPRFWAHLSRRYRKDVAKCA